MPAKQWKISPEMEIDPKKKVHRYYDHRSRRYEIALAPEHAPITVNNFVFLTRQGFYDGVLFHRVIANFMIQGGDPTGTGMGGPGYKFRRRNQEQSTQARNRCSFYGKCWPWLPTAANFSSRILPNRI